MLFIAMLIWTLPAVVVGQDEQAIYPCQVTFSQNMEEKESVRLQPDSTIGVIASMPDELLVVIRKQLEWDDLKSARSIQYISKWGSDRPQFFAVAGDASPGRVHGIFQLGNKLIDEFDFSTSNAKLLSVSRGNQMVTELVFRFRDNLKQRAVYAKCRIVTTIGRDGQVSGSAEWIGPIPSSESGILPKLFEKKEDSKAEEN